MLSYTRTAPVFAAIRRRAISSSSSSGSGVVAAAWPEGLLQSHQGKRPTAVSARLASELLYEVGWQSRHSCIDVRPTAEFVAGRARGAYNVPLEPYADFVTRAAHVIEQIHLDLPAAQHLARASLPKPSVGSGTDDSNDDDATAPHKSRLVITGDDTSSLAFSATAALLSAGYTNAVCLEVGFGAWREMGLPCDSDFETDEFPDSTF